MRQIFAALMMGITCATVGRSENIVVELRDGVAMEFVWIEPGTFLMGSPASSLTRGEDEGPQHEVSISKGFYLGKFEITQAQWVAVMGTAPWTRRKYVQAEPNHPAVYISWVDMQEFLRRLNEAADRDLYRLPTEAEWEYACRAGTTTSRSFGDDESLLGAYAWYLENVGDARGKFAQPVGSKQPNPWGLYDMHGNVWEWVQDWYSSSYANAKRIDSTGAASGSTRVMRGGGFVNHARNVRSAKRFSFDPSLRYCAIGARLVMKK